MLHHRFRNLVATTNQVSGAVKLTENSSIQQVKIKSLARSRSDSSILCYNQEQPNADVAELADAPDLGSGSERSEGSSPFIRIDVQSCLWGVTCQVIEPW